MNTQIPNNDEAQSGASLPPRTGSAALTLATLAAIAASISKPPPWRHCTLTPENFERLRHDPEFRSDKMPTCGIEIHVKHGQVADSWMFSDSKTLRKYLAGELSELDLMGLMETGACQPNMVLPDTDNTK